jgi:protein phosphatase
VNLLSSGVTDPGRAHEVNEDAFLADDARRLYVVSDGVGRYEGAATASRLVVESVAAHLGGPPDADARRWLLGAARKAASALVAAAKRDRALRSMSATLTFLQEIEHEAHILHVGDSRAYLWRGGRLEQLTRDHSVAFEQLEIGAITKDELRTHPNQRLLTRTLRASSALVIPELSVVPILPGDVFLLCSDGLTKELTDEQVATTASRTDPALLARALVDRANEAGGRDNVTVVVVVAR